MAISTNGTVIARLAGGLYNTVLSNATYLEVASQDPSTLANTLYTRDFAKSTDLAVATTLVTNLGLSSVAGLANWVAAQLTAAGAANKGAKVVSLLNDFAGMTADTTYGAQATAFNTKVDAALAAAQKTGAVTGVFADAGTVAVTNATFTLTTGVDAFTGGAGNDTLVATVATMGSLDTATGGDGTDTISINESVDVASLPGTYTGFETLSLTTSGSIGAVNVSAGTTTAAVANESTWTALTSGTFAGTDVLTVTIGSAVYTTTVGANTGGGGSGPDAAALSVADVIKAHLGDDSGDNDLVDVTTTTTNSTTGVVKVTSKKAGTALPSITVTSATAADTFTKATATGKSNVTATGPGAIKEVIQIALTGTDGTSAGVSDSRIDGGDNLVVSIDGVDYVGAVTPGTDNSGYGSVANAASSVAALINAALGAGTAVASAGTVIVTAPTAGTPLPYISVSSSNSNLADAFTVSVQNQAANAAVTSASAVAAPTGVTTYAATATGVANVSASATAKLTAKGTTVQTSGGLDVTATGTKSVGVSAAKGAVVVSTSNASTGEVLSNPGTGATATYAKGIYISGGTTVNVTQAGATITSGAKSDTRANTIQVGVNPTAAKDASTSGTFAGAVKSPTGNDFYNAVGGIANDPTGDVTITTATTPYTTAAGKTAVAYGTGTTSVYTNGGSTVSITGTGTTTVTDVNTTFVASSATDTTGAVAGASKLSTVNLTGLSGTATIKSDSISTVSVKDGNTAAVVNVNNSGTTGANSGAFNLNVGNSTVTVTNATATSVNVGSTAATTEQTIDGSAPVTNSSTLTLNAVKATSLNVTNANSLTLATGTAGLAKVATITASGAGNLTANVTSASDYAKLVTVDASAKTGKVALTIAATPADAGQVIKTGSGDDTVTLTGAIGSTNATLGGLVTTTVDLGAGNDKLVKDGGSVITGAAIDAGAGTDTLDVTLVTIGNSAIFKNFERVNLKGATTATAFDATLLTNSTIDGIQLGGDLSAANGTFSVTNLSGTAVNATVTASTDAVVTATLATSTGTSDALNLNFATTKTLTSGTPAINTVTTYTVKGITSTGIETVNVTSAGSITNAVDFTNQSLISNVLNTYTDTSNKTSSIVVTGAKEFTLGTFTVTRDSATKLTVTGVDFTSGADGVYQNSTLDAANTATADVAAALTLIDASATTGGVNIWAGVADALTSDYDQFYDGLTIKGGSGSDMIRNSADAGVTTGGDGKDWLIVDGYLGSADGGAGDDTLVVSGVGVRATLTGGAGKDTFNLSGATMAASSVTLNSTSTLKFNTITDFEVGDILQFDADGVANSAAIVDGRTAVAAATDNSLFGAIDAALRASGVTQDVAVWFTYGGNTYVAYEDGSNGFAYGDNVVKLIGTHILSASAVPTVTTGLFGEA